MGSSQLIAQFGLPVGYTVVLTVAVRLLYNRAVTDHAAEMAYERKRSEEAAAELRALNETVREKVVPALVEASKVNAEATRAIGEVTAVIALTRRQS